MPWRQHIIARHAAWGGRLLDPAAADRPWVALARGLLPACGAQLAARRPRLPPPLVRVLGALFSLPGAVPVADVERLDAAGRAAVAGMPLAWLAGPAGAHATPAACEAAAAATLGSLYAQLAAAQERLRQLANEPGRAAADGRAVANSRLQAAERLAAQLPPAWAAAGSACRAEPRTQQPPWLTAVQAVAAWEVAAVGERLRPWQLTVKAATRVLLADRQAQRTAKLAESAALVQRTAGDAAAALRRAWLLPWDNRHKQVLWALLRDAIPTAARLRQAQRRCGCGALASGRPHHFWECPVAQAVVGELRRHLPEAAGAALQPAHVWLGEPPPETHAGSWAVVALAALGAMERARRRMAAVVIQAIGGGQAPPTRRSLPLH